MTLSLRCHGTQDYHEPQIRQRRQVIGLAGGAHEEIVHRLIKEIDLGKDMEKVVTGLGEFGDEFDKVSGDV